MVENGVLISEFTAPKIVSTQLARLRPLHIFISYKLYVRGQKSLETFRQVFLGLREACGRYERRGGGICGSWL